MSAIGQPCLWIPGGVVAPRKKPFDWRSIVRPFFKWHSDGTILWHGSDFATGCPTSGCIPCADVKITATVSGSNYACPCDPGAAIAMTGTLDGTYTSSGACTLTAVFGTATRYEELCGLGDPTSEDDMTFTVGTLTGPNRLFASVSTFGSEPYIGTTPIDLTGCSGSQLPAGTWSFTMARSETPQCPDGTDATVVVTIAHV